MVAGWDRLISAWFTRLNPRWKTPTRSVAVIVGLAIGMGLLATYGTGAPKAFQVINSVGNIGYKIYYVMMFAIPLIAGDRFGVRAGFWLKLASHQRPGGVTSGHGIHAAADCRRCQQVGLRSKNRRNLACAKRRGRRNFREGNKNRGPAHAIAF